MAGRALAISVLLIAALGAGGCKPEPTPTGRARPGVGETVRMHVASEQVDCVGVAPMRCLQVRYAPGEDWQLFYDAIVGFTFEPGFDYELSVVVTPIVDAPADGSSLRYELIEVVSKKPA